MSDHQDWLDQVTEEIIDPLRPIVDPHHHLWYGRGGDYLLADLRGDTSSAERALNQFAG